MQMRFNVKISRYGAFYFFVENLACWHSSCRQRYNKTWRSELGPFSNEEEEALNRFKDVRQRYPAGMNDFKRAFFTTAKPFEELRNFLTPEEAQTFEEVFAILKSKFEALYEKDLSLLHEWQRTLDKAVNNPEISVKILSHLNRLYSTDIGGKDIDVYILFSAALYTGGGANIDDRSLSVEVSRYPLCNVGHVSGIIWHELIHVLFQNKYFFPLLLQTVGDEHVAGQMNELVAGALFPRGTLGVKILKDGMVFRLSSQTDENQTKAIVALTREYIDAGKSFDSEYIGRLRGILNHI